MKQKNTFKKTIGDCKKNQNKQIKKMLYRRAMWVGRGEKWDGLVVRRRRREKNGQIRGGFKSSCVQTNINIIIKLEASVEVTTHVFGGRWA